MKQVGTYAVKTHLSHLLDEVAHGTSFSITRRGTPIAMLIPYRETQHDPKTAVQELRALRKGITWGKGMSTRQALQEGRR